jgi:class 3 adenylate cyclase/tetratricopeptide (TPR) repeat protein
MESDTLVCPACGRESPPDVAFCARCGASLKGARSEQFEERKVVTVLFADLVGSTAQAESHDPEEVRTILSAYYARLRGELERHGGTVEKFIGDAVMAVFGAPVAHEDDPERAVRAALAIRDALAESAVDVRIAVHTGEALVALGARVAAGEAMVAGDVVNTAARLQIAAPVNGILVGETTYRTTEHAIRYGKATLVRAKGKAEPVQAWEAIEAKARAGVDVERDPPAALVGREDEVSLLVGALERVRREREPQLVTLVGVPGIGKSRLVAELLSVVDALPELITWRQGRCLPYGDGVSFWALGEMAKAQAGVLESDSAEVADAKLSEAVAVVLPEPAEAEWVRGHLRPLLGLGGAARADDHRTEAFAAWRRFFEALADLGPTVLVFEDLHWADDGLLDFVDHLVEWVRGVPMLVVATARPELLERRPGWGGGKANASTASLSPLSDVQTARLVGLLLDQAVVDADLQAALLARAGGNPLYAEEYVRMLRDGRSPAQLPETIQGIIAARLDALSVDGKQLIQDAAVVGKVFWAGAIASIGDVDRSLVEDRLHALERKEFIRRDRRSSIATDTEYAFRHVLVRDVAYAQIPRSRRVDKHRRAAEWIDSLTDDRSVDQAGMVAHHYGAALELAHASGQDTAMLEAHARRAFREAGERALRLSALSSAAQFFARELELTAEDDSGWPDAVLTHAKADLAVRQGGEFPLVPRALDRLLAEGRAERAAEAEVLLAESDWFAGRNDSTFARLAHARELIAGAGASWSTTKVHAETSRFLMLASRNAEAVEIGRHALALAEELDLHELQAHALVNIGTARVCLGDSDGFADLERAFEIASAINSGEALRAVGNHASLYGELGDLRRTRELYEEVVELSESLGVPGYGLWAIAEFAVLDYLEGRWDETVTGAQRYLAGMGEAHYLESVARMLMAEILVARGDEDLGIAESDRALSFARSVKDPQNLYPTLALSARLLAETGRAREAADRLTELRALVAARVYTPSAWVLNATFALEDIGSLGDATTMLAGLGPPTRWLDAATAYAAGDRIAAAEILAQMGNVTDEAHARLRAAELGAQREQIAPALAFYRSVGASALVRRAEALLAASA